MDPREKAPAGEGPGQAPARRRAVPARSAGTVADQPQPVTPQEPVSQPSAPTVDGGPVREFAALVSPAAFLITRDGGTHEITRAYYQNGQYTVAHSTDRLGALRLLGVALDNRGMTLRFSEGFTVFIPEHRVQATYRV